MGGVRTDPFGITSASRPSGSMPWTAREAGDRLINEHDESEPDSDEELYLVWQGQAVFVLDDDRVPAPAGTLVFAPPGVKRTGVRRDSPTR